MIKATVLLLSMLAAVAVRADDVVEQRCRDFLTHLAAVHVVSTGTHVAFTGEFKAIPAGLASELQRQFPNYIFRIAKMTFTHWGPEQVRLLLVVDRLHSCVHTYLWDVWFEGAPFSFGTVFDQSGQPLEAARARVSTLARPIGFQTGWTLGDVTVEDGVIFAPLINEDKQVERIIRSRVTPNFPAEPLGIVHPDDKLKAPVR